MPSLIVLRSFVGCGRIGIQISLNHDKASGIIGLLEQLEIDMSRLLLAESCIFYRFADEVSDIRFMDMYVDMGEIHVVTVAELHPPNSDLYVLAASADAAAHESQKGRSRMQKSCRNI